MMDFSVRNASASRSWPATRRHIPTLAPTTTRFPAVVPEGRPVPVPVPVGAWLVSQSRRLIETSFREKNGF
jgi:hypothetical protein